MHLANKIFYPLQGALYSNKSTLADLYHVWHYLSQSNCVMHHSYCRSPLHYNQPCCLHFVIVYPPIVLQTYWKIAIQQFLINLKLRKNNIHKVISSLMIILAFKNANSRIQLINSTLHSIRVRKKQTNCWGSSLCKLSSGMINDVQLSCKFIQLVIILWFLVPGSNLCGMMSWKAEGAMGHPWEESSGGSAKPACWWPPSPSSSQWWQASLVLWVSSKSSIAFIFCWFS